jgi:tRNA A37 N6-isopentenylltransferase MiaA
MSDLTPHPETVPEDRQAIRRIRAQNDQARLVAVMARILQHIQDGVTVDPHRIEGALEVYRLTQKIDELLEQSVL